MLNLLARRMTLRCQLRHRIRRTRCHVQHRQSWLPGTASRNGLHIRFNDAHRVLHVRGYDTSLSAEIESLLWCLGCLVPLALTFGVCLASLPHPIAASRARWLRDDIFVVSFRFARCLVRLETAPRCHVRHLLSFVFAHLGLSFLSDGINDGSAMPSAVFTFGVRGVRSLARWLHDAIYVTRTRHLCIVRASLGNLVRSWGSVIVFP